MNYFYYALVYTELELLQNQSQMEETEYDSQDQIYEKAFPSKSGHVHGYGAGPKPKKISALAQYRHAQLEEAKNKMEKATQVATDATQKANEATQRAEEAAMVAAKRQPCSLLKLLEGLILQRNNLHS